MPKFVEAVVVETGRKQRIPAAWLDHPVLGKPFRESPRSRAARKANSKADQPEAPAEGTDKAPASGDKE